MRAFILLLAVALSNFTWALDIADGLALCHKIATEIDPRLAYASAQEQFPDDPVRRALWIRQHYGPTAVPFTVQTSRDVPLRRGLFTNASKTYDWLIPETVTGNHPSIWAYPDYELNTVRYASPNDLWWHGDVIQNVGFRFKKFNLLPRKNSKLIVNWTHGLTGVISNSGRIFSQLKVMNGVKTDGAIHKALVEGNYWIDTTAVGADLPFHGAGPLAPENASLAGSIAWRSRYYHSLLNHQGPQQGLVAASRSGENLFIAQLAFEQPQLFKGMIWMSPMHPVAGFNEAIEGYNRVNISTALEPNPHALRWFANSVEEMHRLPGEKRWWESERGVPDVPTLVLVGEKDPEVPKWTREIYKNLAAKNPDIFFYVEVPGAGHDVFAVTETWAGVGQKWSSEAEARATGAWKYVYWFLETKVEKTSNRPAPELGWLQ